MSDERDDGGPAMPVTILETPELSGHTLSGGEPRPSKFKLYEGVSIRDYFAAKAPSRMDEDFFPQDDFGRQIEKASKFLDIDAKDFNRDFIRNWLRVDAKLRYMHADCMLEARK